MWPIAWQWAFIYHLESSQILNTEAIEDMTVLAVPQTIEKLAQ